jgi:hypothetical protein
VAQGFVPGDFVDGRTSAKGDGLHSRPTNEVGDDVTPGRRRGVAFFKFTEDLNPVPHS